MLFKEVKFSTAWICTYSRILFQRSEKYVLTLKTCIYNKGITASDRASNVSCNNSYNAYASIINYL
jgi:hypothetical protein